MSGYFEGWYLKHQANGRTLALIPGRSERAAFVQVITETASYQAHYPLEEYQKGKVLRVGDSIFSKQGVMLRIHNDEIDISGKIRYGGLAPVKSDIMGPFCHFPMECRHDVISMRHGLSGCVTLNGEALDFTNGTGYIEADSGTSFPPHYMWVHCNDFESNCSIMASVARIPFFGMRFWGCICVVWIDGKEYRLATYRGVKIKRCDSRGTVLEQGDLRLTIAVDVGTGHRLAAPRNGSMIRAIQESASCSAKFRFTKGGRVLFEGESKHASCEYAIGAANAPCPDFS